MTSPPLYSRGSVKSYGMIKYTIVDVKVGRNDVTFQLGARQLMM